MRFSDNKSSSIITLMFCTIQFPLEYHLISSCMLMLASFSFLFSGIDTYHHTPLLTGILPYIPIIIFSGITFPDCCFLQVHDWIFFISILDHNHSPCDVCVVNTLCQKFGMTLSFYTINKKTTPAIRSPPANIRLSEVG